MHRALGADYDNKLATRLWQVRQDIESRGHYDLSYEELVFGARTAWRNAPRCVNRIVWRQLEVSDTLVDIPGSAVSEKICLYLLIGGNVLQATTLRRRRRRRDGWKGGGSLPF